THTITHRSARLHAPDRITVHCLPSLQKAQSSSPKAVHLNHGGQTTLTLLEEDAGELLITPAGLAAIGAPAPATVPVTRTSLRNAAQAAVAAGEAGTGLEEALTALRAALGAPHKPRADTKRAQVLALLRRPEGASGSQIAEVTGWAPHTVRGFLAGLQRQGSKIEVLERVRQVGPGKAGARGSYTVYRLADNG
ncbi:MAG TPA: DUF3489 domain-containing protein, partial [Roseomonas sp.]|nr:DUF3489 domain-containing protein [Roseomonas sp.]